MFIYFIVIIGFEYVGKFGYVFYFFVDFFVYVVFFFDKFVRGFFLVYVVYFLVFIE